ncbi:MAG: cob(I)yrinic acid a,c-diamide adenosyltransferase, partial [Clostridiales bacterium]|nr:cob(I)yrinic acid a,c-diamide adenosyltransferase [Clostridiales bacterium]
MDKTNKLHVITGEGKGKTTAAMGLALRMLGINKPVFIVQFMKQGNSSELVSLKKLPLAYVHEGAVMKGFTYQMDDDALDRTREEQTAEIGKIMEEIQRIQPALIVLDELAVAASLMLVPPKEAMRLVEMGLEYGEVVVTGRGASKALIEKADYVSLIQS